MGAIERRSRIAIDPSLLAEFHNGPLDGMRTADFPPHFAGVPLTGFEVQWPLSQPAQFSLYAVYRCTALERSGGSWRFDFVQLQGPDGETLTPAGRKPERDGSITGTLDEGSVAGLFERVAQGDPLTPAQLMPTRARLKVTGRSR